MFAQGPIGQSTVELRQKTIAQVQQASPDTALTEQQELAKIVDGLKTNAAHSAGNEALAKTDLSSLYQHVDKAVVDDLLKQADGVKSQDDLKRFYVQVQERVIKLYGSPVVAQEFEKSAGTFMYELDFMTRTMNYGVGALFVLAAAAVAISAVNTTRILNKLENEESSGPQN